MRRKFVTALAVVAVTALLVTNPLVADAARQITSRDIKNNSVTSQDVKNGSLRARDFAPGQLPAGPAGADGVNGSDGFRIVEAEEFSSQIDASVPVLEGGFQFVGSPVSTTVTPEMRVQVNAQVAVGSSLGSDTDLAICADLGDGTVQVANTFLTVPVTDRDVYAMTALFRVDAAAEVTFGPCVGNGNLAPGTYHALDDNDWVNGDYMITRGPGDVARPTGVSTLGAEQAKG
jgi:hypothetical protein